ncbi:MAG: hypothetical protein AMS20_11825 [Gemmatimonas sp. SG8_28]|nr:MAG: hypothetical protein AMS20_11825 [Gemmatimonas sp. SG8_28]
MRWRIPLFITLVALVAVSCDQQPAGPLTDEVAAGPTFNFMNGPPAPNPYMVRYEQFAGWYAPDLEDNVMLTIGFDPVELCNGIYDFDAFDWQEHTSKNDPTLVRWVGQGYDLRATLWGISDFDCEFFLGASPLQTGTVDKIVFTGAYTASGKPFQQGYRWHGDFNGSCHWVEHPPDYKGGCDIRLP